VDRPVTAVLALRAAPIVSASPIVAGAPPVIAPPAVSVIAPPASPVLSPRGVRLPAALVDPRLDLRGEVARLLDDRARGRLLGEVGLRERGPKLRQRASQPGRRAVLNVGESAAGRLRSVVDVAARVEQSEGPTQQLQRRDRRLQQGDHRRDGVLFGESNELGEPRRTRRGTRLAAVAIGRSQVAPELGEHVLELVEPLVEVVVASVVASTHTARYAASR